jgi:pre-mRNA-processing factor 6
VIAAQAVRQLPKVPSIWLAAADLETTSAAKKKIFRQALDVLPQSVQIWKALINETEDIESVRLLFAKACEEVKLDESLWIGYARVSSSEHAQQVLNQARKAIPTSHNIWIQACRLAEESGTPELCDRIMQRATKALVKDNAMGKRGEWLEKAMECEENQNIITSGSIIKMTIGWGLDEDDDRRDVWLEDAKTAISHGRYYTARAILTHALSVFILSSRLWHALIDLEKTIEQSSESTSDPQTAVKPPVGSALLSTMESAVNACPSSESLWLAYAREIAQRDPDEARKVIARSFNCMPGNENLYLQAVQMEMDNGAIEMARNFLAIARESAATDRIFIKSAVLERNVGELDRSLEMISSGLQLFPQSWKLYAIKGQIYASQGKQKESESAFAAGIRATNSPVLSILLSRLLERSGALIKARSTLDKSRSVHSKNDTLWCEAVRLERRAGQIAAAQRLMANALQLCPHSGLLWAEKIWYLESRTQRKPRALEAIKKVENDAQLFVVVGRIFWSERRLDKAHTWFMKAIQTDSQFGDAWIWYYKFLVSLPYCTSSCEHSALTRSFAGGARHRREEGRDSEQGGIG